MQNDNDLLVERDGPAIVYLFFIVLFGLGVFFGGMSIYTNTTSTFKLGNMLLAIIILLIALPMTIFYCWYVFRKTFFRISDKGIEIPKRKIIAWEKIMMIEIKKFPGPKIEFYYLKLLIDQERNATIFFSSDIKPRWDVVEESLRRYAENKISA